MAELVKFSRDFKVSIRPFIFDFLLTSRVERCISSINPFLTILCPFLPKTKKSSVPFVRRPPRTLHRPRRVLLAPAPLLTPHVAPKWLRRRSVRSLDVQRWRLQQRPQPPLSPHLKPRLCRNRLPPPSQRVYRIPQSRSQQW